MNVRTSSVWVASVVLLSACAEGEAPRFVDLGPQVAVVGQPLLLRLIASDPEGDSLRYGFSSMTLTELQRDAQLAVSPDGQALFSWTPLATDLGEHFIEFSVSDADHAVHMLVAFDVRGAVGEGSAPVFRKPLGEGIVHDLGQAPCVTPIEIEVHDPDDTELTLAQAAPLIPGAEFSSAPDGLQGLWQWCPDGEQRAAAGIHELVLSADDGDNPATIKRFSVWLKRADADCPSQLPTLDHVPMAVEKLADPEIFVSAGDDVGLLAAPIVFWSTEPVEIEEMEPRFMELVAGDLEQGSFRVRLPNPAVPLGVGASASLYYRISVGDEDSCFVQSPAEGVHEIVVSNPGGEGAALCQPCSWDDQCGTALDLCLQFGVGSAACGRACEGSGDCDAGFLCPTEPLTSVQGQEGRQCIPEAGICEVEDCEDDGSEPNDTLEQALAQPAFAEGLLADRRLCPHDEDWYRVELGASAGIIALVSGPAASDLDLALIDDRGLLRAIADGPEADEQLASPCLEAGTYALRVYGSSNGIADYDLSYVLSGC